MSAVRQQVARQLAWGAGNEAGRVRLVGQQASEAVNGDAGPHRFFFTVHNMRQSIHLKFTQQSVWHHFTDMACHTFVSSSYSWL